MKRGLVIDLETGGLDPRTCGITDIAAAVFEYSEDWKVVNVVGKFQTFVKPVLPRLTYSDEALKVQGKSLQFLVDNGIPEQVALANLASFIQRNFTGIPAKEIDFWGHNSSFDLQFLIEAYKGRHGLYTPFNWYCLDTMALFRILRIAGYHSERQSKLDNVAKVYGFEIPAEDRHTALGDVMGTILALKAMMPIIVKTGVVESTSQNLTLDF